MGSKKEAVWDEVGKRGNAGSENEELSDLLEDLKSRIQDIREEMADELDDLEDMVAEAIEVRRH